MLFFVLYFPEEYQQFDVLSVPSVEKKKDKKKWSIMEKMAEKLGHAVKAIKEYFIASEDQAPIRETLSIFLGSCLQ